MAKREWFKRTEAALYRYPIYKARLEQIEDELNRLEPRLVAKRPPQYDEGEIKDSGGMRVLDLFIIKTKKCPQGLNPGGLSYFFFAQS